MGPGAHAFARHASRKRSRVILFLGRGLCWLLLGGRSLLASWTTPSRCTGCRDPYTVLAVSLVVNVL